MCGICGFVINNNTFGRETLEKMNQAIKHRGPDDGGCYLTMKDRPASLESLSRGNVGLGHRRLSIIDLSSAGHQPMSNENGRVWIAFNGEIYNFAALRKQLEREHSFRSRTDTEVLVHGYEQWGTGLFERLQGMFAIAIWDAEVRQMLLARDRLGIKPLYMGLQKGDFLFASELGAIRTCPAFVPEIDERSMEMYFTLSYVPSPRSIFKGIEKLLPGHFATFSNGILSKYRYWETPALEDDKNETRRQFSGSYTDALTEVDRLVKDSVTGRMMSDVPIGAFLSGGIDSSLVVSHMSRVADRPVRTFSIGFEDDDFDESHYARKVAEYLGTDHTGHILDPEKTREMILNVVDNLDEPSGDPSVVPTWFVSDLAKKNGITVALSGDGGDEIFCGYQRYATMAKLLRFDGMPRLVRKGIFSAARTLLPDRLSRIAGDLTYDEYAQIYFSRMSGWKQGEVDIFRHAPDKALYDASFFQEIARRAAHLHPLDRLMLIDMKTYMVDDVLSKVDRMSMAVSLEVRVPLLDHRLVEFAGTLPIDFKRQHGVLKSILKDVSYRHLPRNLLERPKTGFGVPVGRWLRKELNDLLGSCLGRRNIEKLGILDPAKVEKAVRGFESGRLNNSRFIWGLLIFALWWEKSGLPDMAKKGNESGYSLPLSPFKVPEDFKSELLPHQAQTSRYL
ncbi:MAG: asparagine synthase (glutamine-hydrolyzing) [Candidatus Krumholzibacteriota bacterium]|nr:asparagine synthase (glutamine-hydrolyzing) [Candidatus Krumholzibacteriota bacterium]